MKYYEKNGTGNQIGALGLQCPICGNAALALVEKKVNAIVTSDQVGLNLRIDNFPLDGDDTYFCPQCNIPMESHEDVAVMHKTHYKCPGCIICGNVYDDVFKVCRDCILEYRDAATPCHDCEYYYSKTQKGLDIEEMKVYYNVESVGVGAGEQMELFKMSTIMRPHFSNVQGRRAYQ